MKQHWFYLLRRSRKHRAIERRKVHFATFDRALQPRLGTHSAINWHQCIASRRQADLRSISVGKEPQDRGSIPCVCVTVCIVVFQVRIPLGLLGILVLSRCMPYPLSFAGPALCKTQ
jgi:hypothetical protein